MKQFLLSIPFLFSFFIGFGQCPPLSPYNDGIISFSSQAEIDNYLIDYPNCTELNANSFSIADTYQGANNPIVDIIDLSPLSQITNITVDVVSINSNLLLSSLAPLENIEIRTRVFYIEHNPLLTDLHGLEGVRIRNDFEIILGIQNNVSLLNLDGLNGLDGISALLTISHNDALLNIDALSSFREGEVALLLESNPSIISILGLRNANLIREATIIGNTSLTNCNIIPLCQAIDLCIENPENNCPIEIENNGGECIDIDTAHQTCITCGTELLILNTQLEVDDFPLNCTNFTPI